MRGVFFTDPACHVVTSKRHQRLQTGAPGKSSNVVSGLMLLHISANYHHVVDDCKEAWVA